MQALLRRYPGLAGFPHVDFGVRPTAVEEHRIDGLPVLVKRDDRSSALYGGNKVRSLEFLLARRARRLLTYSTLGAHHAYATALCGRRIGLETVAVLLRRGPRGPLLGALHDVAAGVVEVDGVLGVLAATASLWRRGTRIIPPGGASARGALGYLQAALELEPVPRRIYAPLGSGTTVSGLLAGLMLKEATTELVAVRVADAVAGLPGLLWSRALRAVTLLRRHDPTIPRVSPGGVRLRIVSAPGRYGEATHAALAAVAAAGDLGLEPTYTGKTLAVLLEERRAGSLLLHTYGGSGMGGADGGGDAAAGGEGALDLHRAR